MNVFMTGGTGFIGGHLSKMLIHHGYSVTIATRNPNRESDSVRYVRLSDDMTKELVDARIVINLAGENLFGKRWTSGVKKRLYESRIQTTRKLVSSMEKLEQKPEVLVSASGVNYYGDRGAKEITEETGTGSDFLARLCLDWEAEAAKAAQSGTRVVLPRFGVALGSDGGALATMLPVFRGFIGGSLGPGTQYFPWIHIEDLCNSIVFAIENKNVKGPYNATSPEPVTMDDFTESLGEVLSRPAFFKVPQLALNTVLGEAATLVTSSLRVVPEKLRKHGFTFAYPGIRQALGNLLG